MTLLVVYRKATNHATSKGDIVMRTSADGFVWGAESTIYSDATYDARDPSITRLANGSLIVSFFLYNHTAITNVLHGVMTTISTDNGATWSAPAAIGDGFTDHSACCGPIIQLAGGGLLISYYGKDTGDTYRSVRMMSSANGGATWAGEVAITNGQTDSKDYSEPNLVLLTGGNVLCMIRMDTGTDTIHRSVSADGGATWSAAAACFTGSGAPHTIQLAAGKLVCCYRGVDSRVVMRSSSDSGATWTDALQIDSSSYVGMMYASPIERSGSVAIAYALEVFGEANVVYKTFSVAELP